MPAPVEISGGVQMAQLAKRLKAVSNGGALRREWLRDIRQATAPAKRAIPESARSRLPRRGGLNETVAAALNVTTRTSLSGQEARVRVVAVDPPRHDIHAMNLGRLRHPVYGNRDVWATQRIHPLFFTQPMLDLAPAERRAIADATNRVLRSIVT